MNKIQQVAAEHPQLIGLLFALIAAYGAYSAFNGGMATAMIRGNVMREASEALGG